MTARGWPKIQQWPTAKLVPYARNARTHQEAQVAQIAASIAEGVRVHQSHPRAAMASSSPVTDGLLPRRNSA